MTTQSSPASQDDDFWDEIIGGEQDCNLPLPPAPKDGCICEKTVQVPGYRGSCQPLDCPGGDLCFAKVRNLVGRKRKAAIVGLINAGICVCHHDCIKASQSKAGYSGVAAMRKAQREGMPRCVCGTYFSNEEVRRLGLFSKAEWASKGFKPIQVNEYVKAPTVWRPVYWPGHTGGRLQKVRLFSADQVQSIKRRMSKKKRFIADTMSYEAETGFRKPVPRKYRKWLRRKSG